MVPVLTAAVILLFVFQTLSMKLQHAPYLPQKLLVNCLFSLAAAAALWAGRLAFPALFSVSRPTLVYGIGFGVVFALTILFYNLAIGAGPLAYTTFYFSSSMLIPTCAGILFFREPFKASLLAALVLFLAAFYFLNVSPGGQRRGAPHWPALCALTFVCNGLCAVLQKAQQNATGGAESVGLMLVGFTAAFFCYGALYLFLRRRLPPAEMDGLALAARNALAILLLTAGSAGGNLLLTWLAGRTPASYLFPLVQGGIVVGITLCSVLFFKEKLSRRSCFGLALGVCAIAVINL